ncbi:hypothetical protein [Eikenella corrodens]|uniref:hypothetical protein n=1 Tax=Eikenella corrodens TaxID=539 RepID=UPI00129BE377|nr:hypothetical protein [Eikenella corrodens]MDU1347197.1 hypothetical protein [Eikenella corrodens]
MFELQAVQGMDQAVITQGNEVEERLKRIDSHLTIGVFTELAQHLQYVCQHLTPFHTQNYTGVMPQGELSAAVRSRLADFGWHLVNTTGGGGISVSPNNDYIITVATGTEQTGCENGFPYNKSSKGAVWEQASQQKLPNLDTAEFWVLLFYRDSLNGRIQMELSQVAEFQDKHIESFKERILLPTVSINDVSVSRLEPAEVEEITVERRQRHG